MDQLEMRIRRPKDPEELRLSRTDEFRGIKRASTGGGYSGEDSGTESEQQRQQLSERSRLVVGDNTRAAAAASGRRDK